MSKHVLYLNGSTKKEIVSATGITGKLYIGSNSDPNTSITTNKVTTWIWKGSIADIQVFNKALSDSDALSLYDSYGASGTNGVLQNKLVISNPPSDDLKDVGSASTSTTTFEVTDLTNSKIIGPGGDLAQAWTYNIANNTIEHPIPSPAASGTYIAKIATSASASASDVIVAPALYLNIGNSLSVSGNEFTYTPPTGVTGDIALYRGAELLHSKVNTSFSVGTPGLYSVIQGGTKSNGVDYSHYLWDVPPTQETLNSTGGSWGARDYLVLRVDGTVYVYSFETYSHHEFGYNYLTDSWVDIGGADPKTFEITISGSNRIVEGWRDASSIYNAVSGVPDMIFTFIDPYYVP